MIDVEQGKDESNNESTSGEKKKPKIRKKKKYLIELERNNFALALTLLDAEIAKDPDNPALFYNFAICCSRTNNHKKCISVLEDILERLPRFIELDNIHRLIIYSYINIGEYAKALSITDERLKVNVGDLRLLSFRAHIMEKLGRIEDSIQIHKNILKIRPDYKNSLNAVAYLLSNSANPSPEDIAEATEYIKKAMQQDVDNAAYLDTFGVVLKKRGNKEQALKAFNKALSRSPKASSEILDHLQDLL